jgi:molecular chaperone DnaK
MSDRKIPAIGIDLGTTHSVIAFLDSEGRPTTIHNAEGGITTPSVVFFDETGPVVGKEAARTAPFEPELIAQFAKRDIGSPFYEKEICGIQLPPEVVEAIILRKIKEDAELVLGEIHDVVITVPAYFNEPRRKATQDAGELAGLNVLDIINEPTAAAIAYGIHRQFSPSTESPENKEKETILVYDLGGGTFDATLMELQDSQYTAIGTAGDVYLGGIDWDKRIFDFVIEQFINELDIDPREDSSAAERLKQSSEVAKLALTARSQYKMHCEYEGNRLRIDLSREQFEELTRDLVERTLFTIRKMLKEASHTWDDITSVLLVGGSTRMPMIIEALESESGVAINRSISPDEAVAHGAAVYAELVLSKTGDRTSNLQVKNVNSHDLGVLAVEGSTGMPRRKILIPRNSTLPAKGSGSFKTRDDNQQTVAVNVIEGGDASGRNATKIGTCVVSGLPADLPAKTPVEVRFQYLENGRLTVEAWLPETKSQATLEIKRAAGLSEEKMTYWANWLSKGPILIPSETVADEDEEFVADGSQADVEEEFEPAAAEEQEFDFESFEDPAADESPSADKEPDDITIGEEAASDEEMAEDSGPNLFEGLVTDDAGQEEDGVDTDDSDLANFLRRDSQ